MSQLGSCPEGINKNRQLEKSAAAAAGRRRMRGVFGVKHFASPALRRGGRRKNALFAASPILDLVFNA